VAKYLKVHIMRVTLIIREMKANFDNRLNTSFAGESTLILTSYC